MKICSEGIFIFLHEGIPACNYNIYWSRNEAMKKNTHSHWASATTMQSTSLMSAATIDIF